MKNYQGILGNAITGKIAIEKSIIEQIVIREGLREHIPGLKPDEYEQLEANIKQDGLRDPIVLWKEGEEYVLVDGHNRLKICQDNSIEIRYVVVQFKDENEVKDWMIHNQLGRRNLSDAERTYLIGKIYNKTKSQGKRTDLTSDQSDTKSDASQTAQSIADTYSVSAASVKRAGDYGKGLDLIGSVNPELKAKILKGESEISKKDIQEIGKNPESLMAVIEEMKSSKPEPKKKPSANQIITIAFDYIKNETRPFSEVADSFGGDISTVSPSEFFLKWNSLRTNGAEN